MTTSRQNSDGYVEISSDNIDSKIETSVETPEPIGLAITTSNTAIERPAMRPRSHSELILPTNRQSRDVEAGGADATNSEEKREGSIAGDIAIFLATILIVIPGILYVGLPSLFIITGQSHRMVVHFSWVYWLLVGISYGVYPGLLAAIKEEKDTRRDALLRACGYVALGLGWLAGFGFSVRMLYWIFLGIWFVISGIWWFVSGVVVLIWGGAPTLDGMKGSQ